MAGEYGDAYGLYCCCGAAVEYGGGEVTYDSPGEGGEEGGEKYL